MSYEIDFLEIETYSKNNNIIDEIKSFINLKDGWDYGEGFEITKNVIENACYIFQYLKRSQFKYTVNPTTDGGIKITSMLGVNFLDIKVKNDLSIDIVHEVGIGIDYEVKLEKENVSIEEIEKYLNELLIQSCFLSERYISENITFLNNGLTATVLETSKAVYQSLVWNVQNSPAVTSVRI